MALYVIDINERSKKGKEMINLLQKNLHDRVKTMKEYEAMEEKIIMKEIRKAEKSKLLSTKESNEEFARLRRKLSK